MWVRVMEGGREVGKKGGKEGKLRIERKRERAKGRKVRIGRRKNG